MFDLSLWKHSFELVNKELELTRKKKQALDSLLETGKISQSTYEYLSRELAEAISDLEEHRRSIVEKMDARAKNLEKQVEALELFLANLEVLHAAGDIEEEVYRRQSEALKLGIEATKQELNDIKNSLVEAPSRETVTTTPEETVEVQGETEVQEEPPSEPKEEQASITYEEKPGAFNAEPSEWEMPAREEVTYNPKPETTDLTKEEDSDYI